MSENNGQGRNPFSALGPLSHPDSIELVKASQFCVHVGGKILDVDDMINVIWERYVIPTLKAGESPTALVVAKIGGYLVITDFDAYKKSGSNNPAELLLEILMRNGARLFGFMAYAPQPIGLALGVAFNLFDMNADIINLFQKGIAVRASGSVRELSGFGEVKVVDKRVTDADICHLLASFGFPVDMLRGITREPGRN